MTVQIILILAALSTLVYFVRRAHNVHIRAGKRIAFVAFIVVNIYAVLRPDDTTWIAQQIGVGRGTDLVVYLLVVAFLFGMLNTYLRQREISNHLTDLARTVALRDAELANRDRGMATEPGPSRAQSTGPGTDSPGSKAGQRPSERSMSNNVSTIDIMLPYYGPVDLMQAAVHSILGQQDPDWRLTVVDDGYREPIPEWFAALGDERIRYLRNEQNLGANRNYQRCVELIEHDIAVIMGSDDLMLPDYVSTVRAAFAQFPGTAIVQPGVQVIDEHGAPVRGLVDSAKRILYAPRLSAPMELGGEELAASLLRGNWLYFPSLAWRCAAIREVGFRNGLDVVQDLALVLDLIERGERLAVDPAVCFSYRRHRASDSSWRALDGSRFIEERSFFLDEAARMEARGWHRAARIARRHVSSRLNALTLLPTAVRKRHRNGIRTLTRHAFGPALPR